MFKKFFKPKPKIKVEADYSSVPVFQIYKWTREKVDLLYNPSYTREYWKLVATVDALEEASKIVAHLSQEPIYV